MKKIVALLIAFVCLLTLVACDQPKSSNDSSENKVVYGEKYILSGEKYILSGDVNKDEDEMRYYIFEDKEYLQRRSSVIFWRRCRQHRRFPASL